ncbi:MAG TPA: PIG-L deacetylase family protein [Phycisphaerae bacterium]|nr:PIG-L deacetylase family protein [Phycisphaerae bacterium]
MTDKKLRILLIGAHPDDCEVKCGGTAALWARAGHTVRFVSATNGQTGHHEIGGVELTRRRIAEARAAAAVIGIESQVLPIPNGQIEPTLPYRWMFIRLLREFQPDLVITHRPNDYHPDHRYTSQLVQDSSYVVTVPNTVPETPALRRMPVIMYMSDTFARPYAFQADVAIDIDAVIDTKVDMMHQHASQFYEWVPYNQDILDQVPDGDDARRKWLFDWRTPADRDRADRYREQLIVRYGQKHGAAVKYAEAYEACEYGAPFDEALAKKLFGEL